MEFQLLEIAWGLILATTINLVILVLLIMFFVFYIEK